MALKSGKLNHLIKDIRQRGRGNAKGRDAGKDKIINMIRSWPDDKKRKSVERDGSWMKVPIVFPPLSAEDVSDEPLVIEAVMEGYLSHDEVAIEEHTDGSSRFRRGSGEAVGKIELEVVFEDGGLFRTVMINFTVVRAPSPYNVIFGRMGLRALRAVSSTIHSMIKFPTPRGIATLVTQTVIIAECQRLEKKQMIEKGASQKTLQEEEGPKRVDLTEQTLINLAYPDQLVTIGGKLSEKCKSQLRMLLKKSMDVFAWEPMDMTGVTKRIIEHSLNVNPSVEPVAQKRRVMASERTQVVIKEVEEWVNAGIVRPIKYPTWIANPVLVKKADGSWRMCIDFKNLNSACPKDYYSLPNINGKIESVVGFWYKCFLDAYKGYHQVQMAQDDKEKTAFYTDSGTYCYTKMPFGLKNAGATYQRLVDTAFQSQIGRNLEAYVDDMAIKSNDEKLLIAEITETFDNLRKINMKLNPKNARLGCRKENSSDIWFLSRSAKKSVPFFETLKDITKENKDEYRWTESAEKAFQEMNQCIMGPPLLTTPVKEETLYDTERGRNKLCPHGKVGPSIVTHVTKTTKVLRGPPHQGYNGSATEADIEQSPGKHAKYSVELGAYNITYKPRNAIKGQLLVDFLSEAPVGTHPEEFFRLSADVPN
ncbi:reverse transcriptase domain-containing protein [Tanacetum coccineum]